MPAPSADLVSLSQTEPMRAPRSAGTSVRHSHPFSSIGLVAHTLMGNLSARRGPAKSPPGGGSAARVPRTGGAFALVLRDESAGGAGADSGASSASGGDAAHHIFRSRQFTDREILSQLASSGHQTHVRGHRDMPELCAMGPCFRSLAEAMLGEAVSLGAALEAQREYLPVPLLEMLLARHEVVRSAARVIAESYLMRDVKGTDRFAEFKALPPESTLLRGNKAYRATEFLASGSAGTVFAAVSVNASRSKLARAIIGRPSDSSLRKQLTRKATTESESDFAGSGSERSLGSPRPRNGKGRRRGAGEEEYVLKRVYPTQLDSALNEYNIAKRLDENGRAHKHHCMVYRDLVQESDELVWLVLRRVRASEHGVDLKDFIEGGYFQLPGKQSTARSVLLQLAEGMAHVAQHQVLMRDVKPDNVLVEVLRDSDDGREARAGSSSLSSVGDGAMEEQLFVYWSDFGLAVDLRSIRKPAVPAPGAGAGAGVGVGALGAATGRLAPHTQASRDKKLESELVGFWYDTQKLVPKPKWPHRRPPENAYCAAPGRVHAGSYDVYMLGIIFACIGCGVDIPHIDKASVRERLERVMGAAIGELAAFELGEALAAHRDAFRRAFAQTFGEGPAVSILELTEAMLAGDPAARPEAHEVARRLGELL